MSVWEEAAWAPVFKPLNKVLLLHNPTSRCLKWVSSLLLPFQYFTLMWMFVSTSSEQSHLTCLHQVVTEAHERQESWNTGHISMCISVSVFLVTAEMFTVMAYNFSNVLANHRNSKSGQEGMLFHAPYPKFWRWNKSIFHMFNKTIKSFQCVRFQLCDISFTVMLTTCCSHLHCLVAFWSFLNKTSAS